MTTPSHDLATQARQVFLHRIDEMVPVLLERLKVFWTSQRDQIGTFRETQLCRDAFWLFQQQPEVWLEPMRHHLAQLPLRLDQARQEQTSPPPTLAEDDAAEIEFSLVGDDLVENQILAARAALAALDKGSSAFNDLRLRLQAAEQMDELDRTDPVHAANVAQALVSAWRDAGLTREQWQHCHRVVHSVLALAVAEGYQQASQFLLDQGVLPEIDLRPLVRRAADGSAVTRTPEEAEPMAATSGAAAAVAGRLRQFLAKHLPQKMLAPSPDSRGAGAVGSAPSTEFSATQPYSPPTVQIDWSSLEKGAAGVRAQVRALKSSVQSDQEKAVIEVVALIFDSILTEERIPASIRVWFARMQMPVLRMAMRDADFLMSDQHPARLLIDHMGACVLGFDAGLSLDPLEKEIKRIAQVIEQYPETGRRVFELMYQEFQTFLSQHLRTQQGIERLVSVAQQVEQRETLTVKYTIELRKLLDQVAVREGVRDFLFRIWTEVMAQACVKYGAQDPRTLTIRQAARELVWASAAKASRQERALVIAKVPQLLAQLRSGMALLGYDANRQEAAIQGVSNALADAFMSRSDPIDPSWLDNLTQHLAGLESYLPKGAVGDLELTRDNLELITGVDASHITVLPNTGPAARSEMREQAAALVVGAWYELDHNGASYRVQLAWCSERKQLYLWVTSGQQSFLLQQGRVASYLQANLLRPQAAEGLTVRATRDALDKLDANPERLLA